MAVIPPDFRGTTAGGKYPVAFGKQAKIGSRHVLRTANFRSESGPKVEKQVFFRWRISGLNMFLTNEFEKKKVTEQNLKRNVVIL